MPELLATRFLLRDGSWIDLATGEPVRVHLRRAGSRIEQFAWADRCATLSRLRHPLLNELVDYGMADTVRCFEAWRTGPPLRASGAAAVRMVRHAARLLESHGMPLGPGEAGRALRQVRHGPSPRGRPVGIVLQPRRAADIIADTLSQAAPGGVTGITVRADVGAGLRTLWTSAARVARLEGYLPLAAGLLHQFVGVLDLVAGRHVALFVDAGPAPPDPVRLAEMILTLGMDSARRHVLITWARDHVAGGRAIELDRMGVSAMHAMICRDSFEGPSLDEIDAAVRLADGCPGLLIDRLRGYCVERQPAAVALVHESSPVYAAAGSAPPSSPPPRV